MALVTETPIELISKITEFNDISEGMQDEDLDQVLALVVKLISQDMPSSIIPPIIVKLQAIGFKMSMMKSYYTNWEKRQGAKKNTYYTAAAEIDKLVAALKYLARD